MKKSTFLQGAMIVSFGVVIAFFLPTAVLDAATNEISINNNENDTTKRDVTLSIERPSSEYIRMRIDNDITFEDGVWETYKKTKKWTLPFRKGIKTVYVQFKKKDGTTSQIYSDSIALAIQQGEMGVDMEINENDEETKTRNVTLNIEYSPGVEKMFISNTKDLGVFDAREPTTEVPWLLSEGSGKKTVYIQFRDANGDHKTISDSITYIEPPGLLRGGTLLTSRGTPTYYLGFDGKIHPFLHASVFHSWYDDFDDITIKEVSSASLKQYNVGKPVCIRGGTWLVRFQNFPQLYAVEPGCRLYPLRSEIEARILYGEAWESRVVVLGSLESGIYTTYDRGIHDPDNDVIDRDRDGLDVDTEAVYGSSDALPDTDGDGLSDIEETLVWFTDPTITDTNRNGINDLQDVLNTQLTKDTYITMPDVYTYPGGTIFQNRGDKKYYMSYIDHRMYYLGDSLRANAYTTNNFMERFLIPGSPYIGFRTRLGWFVQENSSLLKRPTGFANKDALYAL